MAPRDGPHAEVQAAGVSPHHGDGAGGVSLMVAARSLAVNAGAAALQRPARPPQRPSMRAYRRAPPGYQLALPLYRPARRSMSWLGSAFFFGLKLLAGGLAGGLGGVLVATALWHESWKPAPSPQGAGNETAAHSSSGETTVYRRPPAEGGMDRGSEADSTDVGDREPPSNYPLRVKTMTFTPPAQDATGTIPPRGRAQRPGGF